ncbi:MAG: DNA mismatch repair protein MutS [Hyphomicrobiales bacterium]|nr:MAG: DNA mismatch repair protein MutS [Hyphomicrobiales bacterium]
MAQTVSPLQRTRIRQRLKLSEEPLPLPKAPPAPRGKPVKLPPVMPAYQSAGKPGRQANQAIEPKLKRKLTRGHIDIDGTIDLHGMRQIEAHAALTRFIHARAGRGDRTLLVITGKGLKKVDGDAAVIVERGVLRSMLPIWLSEPGLAPLIAGWDVAAQGHGGDGAFYVRLRRTERRV